MEIILRQDVDKLGKIGQVIKVKDGFARNFLIPNGLGVPKTEKNLKSLEQEKAKKALGSEKVKREAQELSARLTNLSLTLPVLAQEEDKLYGSITGQDIASALKEEGFEIDKDLIVLDEPIKSLGIFEIAIKLHPQVIAKIKVWIVKK